MERGRLLAITLGAVGGALLARSILSPLAGRAYPRTNRALAELGRRGVKTIVNLHRSAQARAVEAYARGDRRRTSGRRSG